MASKTSIPIEEREPRYRGRPRRGQEPKVPWPLVEQLLVHGERTVDPKTGYEVLRYPSIATLAERFGVSRTLVWKFSHKHRCVERRAEARIKLAARTDEKVIERLSGTQARATSDVARIVDKYIAGFQKALREGKVRVDSPADLDRLVRLKELLTGNADTRSEVNGQISLEAIQGRHRRMRDHVDAAAAEIAGVVGHGSTPDTPAADVGAGLRERDVLAIAGVAGNGSPLDQAVAEHSGEDAGLRERLVRAGLEALAPELAGTPAVDKATVEAAVDQAGEEDADGEVD